jgi:uncharacterized repeat protein (TIGR03803 family)
MNFGYLQRLAQFSRATCTALCISLPAAAAPSLTTLASLPSSGDGAGPAGSLLEIGGTAYGITPFGGAYGYGAVFAYDLTTSTEAVMYSFKGGSDGGTPEGGLIELGGTLYGVTSAGGANGLGTIFSLHPAAKKETVIHSFSGTDGSAPMGALLAYGGKLYGTASTGGASSLGTVFVLDPTNDALTVLHSFAGGSTDGALPMAALVPAGGALYGTTQTGGANGGNILNDPYLGGTVFKLVPASGETTVVWSFGAGTDGAAPEAPVIAIGNTLYGTTSGGGTANDGTLFSFAIEKGAETILHNFAGGADAGGPQGGLVTSNGTLFGAGYFGIYQSGPNAGEVANDGTVFSYVLASGTESVLHTFPINVLDASFPAGTPLLSGTTLIGTGSSGGATAQGALFSLDLTSGAESLLHSFKGAAPGEAAGLTVAGAEGLLATGSNAGSAGAGAVIAVNTVTGKSRTLASLGGGTAGAVLTGALVHVGSLYYGTTQLGGAGCGGLGCGTIFSLDPATGKQNVVYSFTGTNGDGSGPTGLVASGAVLYGITQGGGGSGSGTVFSFTPATGIEKILHGFSGVETGAVPVGVPIVASGKLWGTTELGGGSGTIWALNLKTGVERIAYEFGTNANDGYLPLAGLVQDGDTLYGTTAYGGSNYAGTVFAFVPATGVETVISNFGATNGTLFPETPLTVFNGLLYGTIINPFGTAVINNSGNGTIFSVDPSNGALTTVWTFSGGANGANPVGGPLVKLGNALYGTTGTYGASGVGTVFKLQP